jgi:hypothetical protein
MPFGIISTQQSCEWDSDDDVFNCRRTCPLAHTRHGCESVWQLDQRRIERARHYLAVISKQRGDAPGRLRDFVEDGLEGVRDKPAAELAHPQQDLIRRKFVKVNIRLRSRAVTPGSLTRNSQYVRNRRVRRLELNLFRY